MNIYEHRPFFCRTHVVFMKTSTWCAPDKCNLFDLPLINFPNLRQAYNELTRGDVADIREVFPPSSLIAEKRNSTGISE